MTNLHGEIFRGDLKGILFKKVWILILTIAKIGVIIKIESECYNHYFVYDAKKNGAEPYSTCQTLISLIREIMGEVV